MAINQYKRKYMRLSRKSHNQCKQMAAGESGLEMVSAVPYLDSIINEGNIISK
jgi:hypothetical protein